MDETTIGKPEISAEISLNPALLTHKVEYSDYNGPTSR